LDPAVLAAIAAFVGPIIALAGVLGSQAITNRRERTRLEQERELKRLELEAQRHQQLRAERLKAYIELATISATVPTDKPFDFLDTKAALSRIELVAASESVVNAADELEGETLRARMRARELVKEGVELAEDKALWEHFWEAERKRAVFIDVAREDLTQ